MPIKATKKVVKKVTKKTVKKTTAKVIATERPKEVRKMCNFCGGVGTTFFGTRICPMCGGACFV